MLAIVGVFVRNGSKTCLTLQGYNVRIALKDKLFLSSCKGLCGLKYGVCSALSIHILKKKPLRGQVFFFSHGNEI
jgi:hypothetical protein